MSAVAPQTRGLLVIVSSPSGAGKTTLCRRLLEQFRERISFSVSVTTRRPRAGEQDGVDYHFVDDARFDAMVERGELAEWAVVHGNRYGTPQHEVEAALEGGRDVLFDVDWQGGRQLKTKFPEDVVMIWVLPPSLQVLEARLRRRATDAPEVIERRLLKAKEELQNYGLYQYLVVNDDLEIAYDQVRAIYVAAHTEIRRVSALAEHLVEQVRAG